MIAVAGEALMDLVVDPTGQVSAVPGGGPFNAARTVSRLGARAMFLGRLSDDAFGRRLRAALEVDGVELSISEPVAAPTTLAVAEIGVDGAASYRFYLDGTSAPEVRPDDLPLARVGEVAGLLLGGLGLVIEPLASTLLQLVPSMPRTVIIMVDPNCRPSAIRDLVAYRRRVAELIVQADILKVSTEDLVLLEPGVPADRAAVALQSRGPRAVLLTDGSAPVRVFAAGVGLSVPVPQVAVVDTVGAGDAFAAAFLTWWTSKALSRDDLTVASALRDAVAAAVEVAALTCGVRGADPPRLPHWAAATPVVVQPASRRRKLTPAVGRAGGDAERPVQRGR